MTRKHFIRLTTAVALAFGVNGVVSSFTFAQSSRYKFDSSQRAFNWDTPPASEIAPNPAAGGARPFIRNFGSGGAMRQGDVKDYVNTPSKSDGKVQEFGGGGGRGSGQSRTSSTSSGGKSGAGGRGGAAPGGGARPAEEIADNNPYLNDTNQRVASEEHLSADIERQFEASGNDRGAPIAFNPSPRAAADTNLRKLELALWQSLVTEYRNSLAGGHGGAASGGQQRQAAAGGTNDEDESADDAPQVPSVPAAKSAAKGPAGQQARGTGGTVANNAASGKRGNATAGTQLGTQAGTQVAAVPPASKDQAGSGAAGGGAGSGAQKSTTPGSPSGSAAVPGAQQGSAGKTGATGAGTGAGATGAKAGGKGAADAKGGAPGQETAQGTQAAVNASGKGSSPGQAGQATQSATRASGKAGGGQGTGTQTNVAAAQSPAIGQTPGGASGAASSQNAGTGQPTVGDKVASAAATPGTPGSPGSADAPRTKMSDPVGVVPPGATQAPVTGTVPGNAQLANLSPSVRGFMGKSGSHRAPPAHGGAARRTADAPSAQDSGGEGRAGTGTEQSSASGGSSAPGQGASSKTSSAAQGAASQTPGSPAQTPGAGNAATSAGAQGSPGDDANVQRAPGRVALSTASAGVRGDFAQQSEAAGQSGSGVGQGGNSGSAAGGAGSAGSKTAGGAGSPASGANNPSSGSAGGGSGGPPDQMAAHRQGPEQRIKNILNAGAVSAEGAKTFDGDNPSGRPPGGQEVPRPFAASPNNAGGDKPDGGVPGQPSGVKAASPGGGTQPGGQRNGAPAAGSQATPPAGSASSASLSTATSNQAGGNDRSAAASASSSVAAASGNSTAARGSQGLTRSAAAGAPAGTPAGSSGASASSASSSASSAGQAGSSAPGSASAVAGASAPSSASAAAPPAGGRPAMAPPRVNLTVDRHSLDEMLRGQLAAAPAPPTGASAPKSTESKSAVQTAASAAPTNMTPPAGAQPQPAAANAPAQTPPQPAGNSAKLDVKAAGADLKKPAAPGVDKRVQVAARGANDQAPAKTNLANSSAASNTQPAMTEKELRRFVDKELNLDNFRRDLEILKKAQASGALTPEERKIINDDRPNIEKVLHAFAEADRLSPDPAKKNWLLKISMLKNILATTRARNASIEEKFEVYRDAGMISAGFVAGDAVARSAASIAVQRGPMPVKEVAAAFLGARKGMEAALAVAKTPGEFKDKLVEFGEKYHEMKKTYFEAITRDDPDKKTGAAPMQSPATPAGIQQQGAARITSTSSPSEQKIAQQKVEPVAEANAPSGKAVTKATIEAGKAGGEFAKSSKELYEKPKETIEFFERLLKVRRNINNLPKIADEIIKDANKAPTTLARVGAGAGVIGDAFELKKRISEHDTAGALQSGIHLVGKVITASGRTGGDAFDGAGDAVKTYGDFKEASKLRPAIQGFAAKEMQATIEKREAFSQLEGEFKELNGGGVPSMPHMVLMPSGTTAPANPANPILAPSKL